MTTWRLHDGPRAELAPKAAQLARAAAAGLEVPRGVVLPLHDVARYADDPALRELWRDGPTIVRSALAFEDGALHSGAGLGVSVGGVRGPAALLDAAHEIARGRDRDDADQLIVQAEIVATSRLVLACEPTRDYVEQYDGGLDAFSGGTTPSYSGPLHAWPASAQPAAAGRVARVRAVFPTGAHGLDVELVVDVDDRVHVVQVRPLTAPLHPGWPAFAAAAADAGDAIPSRGVLVLDIEHNPEPLSHAHAALVRDLARERPRTGGLVPIAGWLYTRVLIRDLADQQPAHGESPRAVLLRLQHEILPAARARQTAVADAAAVAEPEEIAALFESARSAFLAMIDIYVEQLIPARRGHDTLAPDPDDPLCLRGRADVLDVLPLAWDVAAEPLGDRRVATETVALPDDDAGAATLLREWDDHLFALGLAPLGAVYRRVGSLTGLSRDVFHLTITECLEALGGRDLGPEIRVRAARRQAAARLSPPGRLVDGEPAGVPPRWLRGLPFGEPVTGPVAQRRDLAHLRAAPPPSGSIVVLPALTAPAAIILHTLGLTAICCEHGGAMSHAALMARELGLSALLGCRGAQTLADGTMVELDTRRGVLRPRPRG
jgi:phosphohistidine swiveling domain-containing protein